MKKYIAVLMILLFSVTYGQTWQWTGRTQSKTVENSFKTVVAWQPTGWAQQTYSMCIVSAWMLMAGNSIFIALLCFGLV